MNRESRCDCDLLSITLKVNIKTSVCVNASIRNPNGWMNQEKVKLWFLTINVSCISYHFVKIKTSQNSNRICYQRLIKLSKHCIGKYPKPFACNSEKKKILKVKMKYPQFSLKTYSNHVIFDALHENPNGIVQVLVRISSSPLPSIGSVHGCRQRSGIACIVSFSTVSQHGFEVLNILGSAVSAQESHLHTKTTSVSCTVGLTHACIFWFCERLIESSFGRPAVTEDLKENFKSRFTNLTFRILIFSGLYLISGQVVVCSGSGCHQKAYSGNDATPHLDLKWPRKGALSPIYTLGHICILKSLQSFCHVVTTVWHLSIMDSFWILLLRHLYADENDLDHHDQNVSLAN